MIQKESGKKLRALVHYFTPSDIIHPLPHPLLYCRLIFVLYITRLNFWDLGGQEELQALWDKYFAECHAIIYTVDSNDRDRVEESKKSFDVMIKNENLKGVPLLVLANKQDLPGELQTFSYNLKT